MSQQITLDVPDEVADRAARFAAGTMRDVRELMVEALDVMFLPMGMSWDNETPLGQLPDEQVVALADLQMSPEEGTRLNELLDQQGAGLLTSTERVELFMLMRIYEAGLLRKSQALMEAVQRGLRPRLDA